MLDPSRCFLPDDLARTASLVFLTAEEARTLNQLRARRHAELLARDAQLHILAELSPPVTVAAVGELASLRELAEHASTSLGLSSLCPTRVVAPADATSRLLLLAHAGWSSQLHEQELARSPALDRIARQILARHAQYAARQLVRIETVLDEMLDRGDHGFARALDGALAYLAARHEVAASGMDADLATHEILSGRVLSTRERVRLLAVQRASLRWNHLGAGLAHPRCHALVSRWAPGRARYVSALAAACA